MPFSFTPLSGFNPPGPFGMAEGGVSGDGRVVAGVSQVQVGQRYYFRAATWDPAVADLGSLPAPTPDSRALAASGDGSTIVGYSSSGESGQLQAFRWTLAEGMQPIPYLRGNGFRSFANAVSADGSVIVGYGDSGAFRWTNGVVTPIRDLASGRALEDARGISADGTMVAGSAGSSLGYQAYLWSNGVMTGVGDLPGGSFSSSALAISDDGSTVTGFSETDAGWEAFRWTEADGIAGLGTIGASLDGNLASFARAVSADGSRVVGQSSAPHPRGVAAFLWTRESGMQSLAEILSADPDVAAKLDGYYLWDATGISDDGETIVGTAFDPDGNFRAFIATIPEPGVAALLALGLGVLGMRSNASSSTKKSISSQ